MGVAAVLAALLKVQTKLFGGAMFGGLQQGLALLTQRGVRLSRELTTVGHLILLHIQVQGYIKNRLEKEKLKVGLSYLTCCLKIVQIC